MRTFRASSALMGLLVIALLLGACAAGGASAPSAAPAAADEEGGIGARLLDGADEAPAGDAQAPDAGPIAPGDGVGAAVDDARIIRTGQIDLEVSDVNQALSAARDGISAMGGYIGASETFNEGDQPIATISYRIPADRWEDALALLRGLNGLTSKVVAERTQAVEVTGQVIDLEARIRNLRASEIALQEIARTAVRVADVLEVQNQLAQVRGQIEQLTAQLTDLEDRAAFATLTATYRLPIVAVEIARQEWDPTMIVDEATASLIQVVQGLSTAGIWFAIVWLPIILVIGLIVAVAAFVMRRLGIAGPRRPKGGEAVAG